MPYSVACKWKWVGGWLGRAAPAAEGVLPKLTRGREGESRRESAMVTHSTSLDHTDMQPH